MRQNPDSIRHEQIATEQPAQQALSVLEVAGDSVAKTDFGAKKNHWPVKVDSLLRPDQGKRIEVKVNPLPKYYKDSFFAKDSLLHSELQGGRYGMAGDPVPYTLHSDNYLTPLLIFSILMLMLCVKRSSKFFAFQIRNFFHVVRTDSILERESASQKRYLMFASMHMAIILALVFFFYSKAYISDTYITYSEYTLMGFYLAGVVGLVLFEMLLQSFVNYVFFDKRQRDQWMTVKLMTNSWAAILLTPMLLLMAYFGLSIENSLIYTLIVIVLNKILVFYKSFLIFFNKKGQFLQIFLYFCTLEVIPPLILWGILVFLANYLKVNY